MRIQIRSAALALREQRERFAGYRSQRHSRQTSLRTERATRRVTECGAFYSSTSRSGLAAPRPRFPPRAAPTARRACTGRYYRPCSSITGMSDIKEVPAPVAGLPTARSPGRTPSAEYLKFLDEGGELIDMADFDFTDRALTPAIRPTHQSLQLMLDNVISILFHVNTRGRRGS